MQKCWPLQTASEDINESQQEHRHNTQVILSVVNEADYESTFQLSCLTGLRCGVTRQVVYTARRIKVTGTERHADLARQQPAIPNGGERLIMVPF